jgi:hypothetical protein
VDLRRLETKGILVFIAGLVVAILALGEWVLELGIICAMR